MQLSFFLHPFLTYKEGVELRILLARVVLTHRAPIDAGFQVCPEASVGSQHLSDVKI